MPSDGKTSYVTRREFYGGLIVVWVFIMVLVGDLMGTGGQSTTRMLLWLGSVCMILVCSVMRFWLRFEARAGMARDDANKVEPPI